MRRAARLLFLADLVVLPLYLKVGLISVPGTYIPVRFDDLIIALTALIWLLSLWSERRLPALPRLIAGAAGLWLLATFIGLLAGAFVLNSIGLFTGLAYWIKPIEYLVLGAIAYDLVAIGAVSLRQVLRNIFVSASIVIGYALLERFGVVPPLPGSRPFTGTATSTFGDFHEFAGYLGILSLLVVALYGRVHRVRARWLALIAIAGCATAMYFTAVRTEYLVLAVVLILVATWRPARLPALFGVTALVVLFVWPFAPYVVNALAGHPISPGTGDGSTNVTTRYTDSTFSYSWNERFNIKWPELLAKAARSPIVGLGPSAATEAADGYYMRAYVEAGFVGLASFVALLGAILLSLWRAARAASGTARSLAVGVLAATVFLATVAILIDTWVASRVMELYWPLLGTTLAVAAAQPGLSSLASHSARPSQPARTSSSIDTRGVSRSAIAETHPWITWRHGEPYAATCPLCLDETEKSALLDVRTIGDQPRQLTLVTCSNCTLRFFPTIGEPASFAVAADEIAAIHFELAVGFRGSIDCLARIDTSRVRRFLEVGCGTGLTLDYARHVHGWDVLGVDTSAMARMAVDELGLTIVDALLGQTEAVEDHAWDLVFACEVFEHVTDPAAFLHSVRGALTPSGVFLMRTPAAEGLEPARRDAALIASLSPGYHTMVHTAASLERALSTAGFGHVRVTREGDTLHAAASAEPFDWKPDAALPPAEINTYLRERVAELSPDDSATRIGLLQQLANQMVNAGDAAAAQDVILLLDRALLTRHGAGVDSPAGAVPLTFASVYCAALQSRAMQHRLARDLSSAEERFAATAELAREGIRLAASINNADPGMEATLCSAELQRLPLTALRDREAAEASLASVLKEVETYDRPEFMLELFSACVGAGANDLAARFGGEVRTRLETAPATPVANEARWALAMLTLIHYQDNVEAARQFATIRRSAVSDQRRWAALYHEGVALWRAGERDQARELLVAVIEAGDAAWSEPARSLIGYSG